MLVMSFRAIGCRPAGVPRSVAWMTVGELRGIACALAGRRLHENAPVLDLDGGDIDVAVGVAQLDLMAPLSVLLGHLVGDRVIAAPARRSTQVRTRKRVPSSIAIRNSS